MREHMKNGLAVARYLENHPCIERVIHPGNLYCFVNVLSGDKLNELVGRTQF